MLDTCDKVQHMPHIQLRNVSPELHRKLKARAAEAGMTLSDYLLRDIERRAELPTLREWVERVRTSDHLTELKTRPADLIREERRSR
jgi:antitoxin FitA